MSNLSNVFAAITPFMSQGRSMEMHPETSQLFPDTYHLFVSTNCISLFNVDSSVHSTFTPLVFSGIFYASNQQHQISFIDALFNCVSAMTVCGLATVDMSSLTGWQQGILFIQMCLGSPVRFSEDVCLSRVTAPSDSMYKRSSCRGLWFTSGSK